jgi:hypothetical protein
MPSRSGTTPRTTRSSRTTPDDSDVGYDEDRGRAWAQMTLKVNLGSYESVDISLGGSMGCENSAAAIAKVHRTLLRQQEKMLGEKGEALRELWGNTNGG